MSQQAETSRMTAWLRGLVKFPAPNRAGWHQAIRMTLAALAAQFGTALVGLHHGYWAVITCLIIVQGSLGATIALGIMRLAGTAAGGALGIFGVLLQQLPGHLPEWVVLLIVIAPAAVLAASRPVLRFAPFTAALILLLAGSGDFSFAVDRIAEIALGCVIGVLVSWFVLPERATAVLVQHSAAILDQLGEFAVVLLAGTDQQARQNMEWKTRQAFAQIQNDMKEVDHERSVMLLRRDPFPERLVRHLQRLRTDVNMLGRAVAPPDEHDGHAELGATIQTQFTALAAALRGRTVMDAHGPLKAVAEDEAATPLGFAIATLQRELGDTHQMLNERHAPPVES